MLTSTYINIVRKYMILRLIFGHYFSRGNSKWVHFVSVLYCLLFILALLVFLVFFSSLSVPYQHISVLCNTLEALNNFVLSLVFKSNFVEQMLTTVSRTGDLLDVKTIKMSWKILGYLLCVWIYRAAITVIGGKSINFSLHQKYMNLFIITSYQVNYTTKTFVFDSLYQRMKLLRRTFDQKYVTINLIGSERRQYKINNIRNCLTVYDLLLKCIQKMDVQIEIWLLCTTIACLVKCVLYMYRIAGSLHYISYDIQSIGTFEFTQIILLALTLSLISLPMIMFEKTKKEVDTIKKILDKQFLVCTDELLREEIHRAKNYLKLRPFKHDICRLVPMGISLPLSMLNLSVTYVIVLAQFNLR